jgi:hypothetical protein
MTNNVRRTFRPTLEALEGRLAPAVDAFIWFDHAAVLTAAQPAPALSSFQWGIGRGIDVAALTAAQPAAASPPVVGLTLPDGPTTAVGEAGVSKIKFNELLTIKLEEGLITPAGSTTAVGEAPSIRLRRVVGDALPTGPTTVVTAAAAEHLKIKFDEFTITKPTDGASPTVGVSPDITFVYGQLGVRD